MQKPTNPSETIAGTMPSPQNANISKAGMTLYDKPTPMILFAVQIRAR